MAGGWSPNATITRHRASEIKVDIERVVWRALLTQSGGLTAWLSVCWDFRRTAVDSPSEMASAAKAIVQGHLL